MVAFYFIALSVSLVIIITLGFNMLLKKQNLPSEERLKQVWKIPLFLGVWLLYVFGISATGLLQSFDLPPKIPLFLVFPLMMFIVFFIRKYKNNALLKLLPESWLLHFQVFRVLVELLIFEMYLKNIFPIAATYEGYNYEIILGASAPLVAYLVFKLKVLPKKVAIIWNFIGLTTLGIVIFIVISSAYFPQFWGAKNSLISSDFGLFPYTLLAGFLAPTAIFMHVLSLTQLMRKDT